MFVNSRTNVHKEKAKVKCKNNAWNIKTKYSENRGCINQKKKTGNAIPFKFFFINLTLSFTTLLLSFLLSFFSALFSMIFFLSQMR